MTIVFSNALPQCFLCERLVDAESIFFPGFTTDDDELLRFSATVVHFGCVKRHPRFGALQKIFRDGLGPDGQNPNGSIVFSVGERACAVWVRPWDMLHFLYAPLMLIVEVPRSSLRAAVAATGTNFSTRIEFEHPGIGTTIEPTGDHWGLHVQLCGAGSVPSSADPDGIMHWKRSTSIDELQNWLADMGRAVARTDSLERMNPLTEVLLRMRIYWEAVFTPECSYRTQYEGKNVALKVNGDFPEGPLYRLCVEDACIEFDDTPVEWVFPELTRP